MGAIATEGISELRIWTKWKQKLSRHLGESCLVVLQFLNFCCKMFKKNTVKISKMNRLR